MAVKLRFRANLYLGEGMKDKKLDKIKKRLEKNPLFSGVFVITLSGNSSDQLEIYDGKLLCQSYYKKNPPYVVGLAASHEDAVSLVQKIVSECLASRGDCRLKEYLQC